MKFPFKSIFSLLVTIIFISSCKKEEVETITGGLSTNNLPTISITSPSNNLLSSLGSEIKIEGQANDIEGLQAISYEFRGVDASFNYVYSNSFEISGYNSSFSENIVIPTNASVGNALINICAIDTDGNKSLILSRDITIRDQIAADITQYETNIDDEDIIRVYFFKNINNVTDSLEIYNFTKSLKIATVKDIGGFTRCQLSVNYPYESKANVIWGEFKNSTNEYHDYTIDASISSVDPNNTSQVNFGIELYEYDNLNDIFSNSSINFDVN